MASLPQPTSALEPIANIVARSLSALSDAKITPPPPAVPAAPPLPLPPVGRYDFDLAEFPVFRFAKNKQHARATAPLIYTDTITGPEGAPVIRTWRIYPGHAGFGGASTQALLFDLLQLYWEQGATSNHIQFGTLRSLFLRRGQRNPSQRDYARLKRDFAILRGLDIQAENAYWDSARQAYVSLHWRLFHDVFYFHDRRRHAQTELPFGFIEVSSVLRSIAATRGFFAVGFSSQLFHQLKPLEQRLALYLAKRFRSEALHRRFVTDLARALPIEAIHPKNARQLLRQTAQGLLNQQLPILAAYELAPNRQGEWVMTFHRKRKPQALSPRPAALRVPDPPELDDLVQQLSAAAGSGVDWRWWRQCALRLGRDGVMRALGQFAEKQRLSQLRNPAAMLTAILKDIARQQGVSLGKASGAVP